MQQIGDWLKKLGMSEYAPRFVENRIDLSVLPDLTDQDLEKMGVLLGDRRKMLRAIRNLDNVSVAATAPAATVEPEPTRQDDAERRQHHNVGIFGRIANAPEPRVALDFAEQRLWVGICKITDTEANGMA